MSVCAAFRRERSRNGKGLSELKSGLQKYVRRGELEKALWCAGELLSFRDAPADENPQRIATNLYHRLMIIFLEDVECVSLWPRIDALNARWRDDPVRATHEWVTVMCTAPRGRMCSHARAVAETARDEAPAALARQMYPGIVALLAEFTGDDRDEPQWRAALTAALRARSRVAVFWAWAIQKDGLSRSAPGGRKSVWTIFAALAEGCEHSVAQLIPMARRWYKELQNSREAYLCWMLPLLAQVDAYPLEPPAIPYAPPAALFEDTGDRELDSYVYDIHVRGRIGSAGLVRFAEEGSHVENESLVVDQVWKAFYNDTKRLAEGVAPVGPPARVAPEEPPAPPLSFDQELDAYVDALLAEQAEPVEQADFDDVTHESQFELIVRAQINTGHGKTDVYFARAPGDPARVVVVKGPFASRAPPNHAVAMIAWKRDNGLPYARAQAVHMIPDRWPEGVPMGIRNRVPRDVPAWFLVADSLLPGPPPARAHGPTTKWPRTDVVDWGRLAGHVWSPLKGEPPAPREKIDYALAVLARFVVGVGDYADRNFLRAGGRVYSLDEDSRTDRAWTHLHGQLRKNRAQMVLRWLDECGAEVIAATRAWRGVPAVAATPAAAAAAARLRAVSELDGIRALFAPPAQD